LNNPFISRATKVTLAPLLMWQSRQVRRRSLGLPEAEGPREGVAGTGKVKLRLLIVGDSSAAGVGAPTQAQALAGRLSEALSQRLDGSVVWQLVARSGDTTLDSLNALRTLSLHPADVMVTALGINDVVARVPPLDWLRRLDALGRLVASRCGVQHVVHSGVPPLQAFPMLPSPLRGVLGREARQYNLALAAWVRDRKRRWWMPLPYEHEYFTDSILMAEDGFHPGPAVYALWAEQLAGMISTEIAPLLSETAPTRRGAPSSKL
jgi:lysophospholipase L1-like esterase